jgi:pyridoxal 5'-phosphate synthase pdxT subunit
MTPTVGVLALQGDVREHVRMLERCGVDAVPVRRERELGAVEGIVIPGGESSTIDRLLRAFELFEPLQKAIRDGLPAFGSCAGMILLADRVLDGIEGQQTLGGLDVTVRRNAFGRQVDSFEAELAVEGVEGAPFHAVFIRAPWVESVGPQAQVLGTVSAGPAAGRIVAVRQRHVIATSFHPEITDDDRVHRVFVEIVRENS